METVDDVGPWLQDLAVLAEQVKATGDGRLADIVSEGVEAVSAAADWKPALEEQLLRLQHALASDGAVPPAAAAPAEFLPVSRDPELISDFVLEAREHLSTIEARLLSLDNDTDEAGVSLTRSGDVETIHSLFRSFHTIKGLAGFLELGDIKDVSHEIETLLDYSRNGRLPINRQVVDVVLGGNDYLSRWLQALEVDPLVPQPVDPGSTEALVRRIRLVASGVDLQPVPEAPVSDAGAAPLETAGKTVQSRSRNAARMVKVDTDKLGYLVDMVGELVIAQSLVRHDPDLARIQQSQLTRNLRQLARITEEVQRTAMSMRMVPIGPLFQKMARLVRDLNRKFGKHAVLETQGENVELDRTIVEELADPLMHMVRNAMDHGIEPREERLQAGKTAQPRVLLRASHHAGEILIEVSDDGRGLNRKKILEKAISRKLIAPGTNLSDSEVFSLIFEPGFSTADQLSDVSGRGVGMDVVRKQIQRLRGSIEIQATPGKGTTFLLKLPLTMAIIDGLIVSVGTERYIVPITTVQEMLRPLPEMVSTVENRCEMVLVRDQLLPVLRLHEKFGVRPKKKRVCDGVLVICDADGRKIALLVDELNGKQEVVIKGLGRIFETVEGVAGGAILGDGKIGLILDLKGLFEGRSHA